MKHSVPITVLVVDDEGAASIAATLATYSIDVTPFEIVHCANVNEAISAIRQQAFDVAVIDMVMPVNGLEDSKAGIQVLHELRHCTPEAQSIVLTARGTSTNVIEAMEAGAFSYVDKTPDAWAVLAIKIRLAAKVKRLLRQAFVSRLAAQLAHDINSPLAVILGWTEMVMGGVAKASSIDISKIVHQEANRINLMVQELLNTAMDTPAPLKLATEDWSVNFKDWEPHLRFLCLVHEVDCDLINDCSGFLQMDTTRMARVLDNLVANAARAVRKRWKGQPGGRIVVAARIQADRLTIVISDNGIGMAADLCSRLFSNLRPDEISGNGLGLSVCAQIVAQHRGEISATSMAGEGTTFTIVLPMLC